MELFPDGGRRLMYRDLIADNASNIPPYPGRRKK